MSNGNGEMAAFELEPALDKNSATLAEEEPRARDPIQFCQAFFALVAAYAMHYQSISIPILVVVFILLVIIFLDGVTSYVADQKYGHIFHDYSGLQSSYQLQLAQMDHWCLRGDDDSCRCVDPTEPTPRGEVKGWVKTHRQNLDLLKNAPGMVDVVFLGDETTEELNGRWMGREKPDLKPIAKFFNKTFTVNGGGPVESLAMGVAGDYIANALWRLKHGEMPEELDPEVWWITIGSNDINKGQCSEEAVLLGILYLAEYIKEQRPMSTVVINSILPRFSKSELAGRHKGIPLHVSTSIQLVNLELKKFCAKHDHLEFFDATPIFYDSVSHKSGMRQEYKGFKTRLMPDHQHLSPQGHRLWGQAVIERIMEIVELDDYGGYDE